MGPETGELRVKIEALNNGCLRIWLSSKELARFGVTVETMEGESQTTRRMLNQLVEAAIRQEGQRCAPALAEAIPVADGCVLLLTPRRRAVGGGLVLRLRNLEALYSLAERWCAAGGTSCTSLYELDEEYRLIVNAAGRLPLPLRRLLCAYGDPLGYGAAAVAAVEEHGRLLCAGHALETLLRLPSVEPHRLS